VPVLYRRDRRRGGWRAPNLRQYWYRPRRPRPIKLVNCTGKLVSVILLCLQLHSTMPMKFYDIGILFTVADGTSSSK